MPQEKPQITFKYLFPEDYDPIYVNGAHGGISPRGEIVVNFYLERPALPRAISHEINPNGTIGGETAVEPADFKASLVRSIENGVIMNYQSAREFHLWLGERLRELESMAQAKPVQAGNDVAH